MSYRSRNLARKTMFKRTMFVAICVLLLCELYRKYSWSATFGDFHSLKGTQGIEMFGIKSNFASLTTSAGKLKSGAMMYGHYTKRQNNTTNIGEESVLRDLETDVPFSVLLADYYKQLKILKDGGFWKPNPRRVFCDDRGKHKVCIEANCNVTVNSSPEESLRSMLRSMKDLDPETLGEVIRLLRPKYTHKKVLLVTAASTDHYQEAQSFLKNIHEFVFPLLTSYKLLFYDLGLTFQQRSEMERFCRCEVRTYPLSAMPPRLQNLKCYTWKALLIYTNLPTADTLIWMDVSVRFYKGTILRFLKHLDRTRLGVLKGGDPIAYHTQKTMFDYFEEKTCSFTHIPEVSSGFEGYKNDRFVREVVLKPWAACALSPQCMCPENARSVLSCKNQVYRKYNHCHRYDQSALGIIISKLFRGHEMTLRVGNDIVDIQRDQGTRYFDEIKRRNKVILFKNFP